MLRVLVIGSVCAVAVAFASRTDAKPAPLPGLPSYTAGYTSWTKLNARLLPQRTRDPHDGTKNVYASKLPTRGSVRYPIGTVIVKEIFRPGTGYIGLVAVMRKLRSGRWEFVEYWRASRTSRFGVFAKGAVCTACHVQAKKTDYVFTKRR